MNRRKSRIWVIIAVSIGLIYALVVIPVFSFLSMFAPMPWQGQWLAERHFSRDYEAIIIVRDYLARARPRTITIHEINGAYTMHVQGRGNVQISDPQVADAVRLLFRRGYSSISMRQNSVIFVRFSGLDIGRGVVYSFRGQTPGEETFTYLTHIEPLWLPGWYYFEDDFNTWRIRNRN
ncbi:MAG: hypothetical protein LBE35_06790 [Clostridiales bacterium]|jgi:hypothetical protein|nr:hypothetical protein [Clostridiales bacterium]